LSASDSTPRIDDAPESAFRRGIRSYVLRQGRMSEAQQRAIDALYPQFGLAFRDTPIDASTIFNRHAPLVLEIGSGMGETTAAIAAARPDTDFIAIEVHLPGIGALLKHIATRGLTNVRVIRHDALAVLQTMIAADSLAGVHLYFPDPWPKKRHHKRRIVQPTFVDQVARKLAPNGYLHMATDWPPYAEHMLEVLRASPLLINTASDYAPRPVWRPLTKFEQRGLKLGHAVHDLVFKKIASPQAARNAHV